MAMAVAVDPSESMALMFQALEKLLRRRADAEVLRCLAVETLRVAGYSWAEVREQLELSAAELHEVQRWLREELHTLRQA